MGTVAGVAFAEPRIQEPVARAWMVQSGSLQCSWLAESGGDPYAGRLTLTVSPFAADLDDIADTGALGGEKSYANCQYGGCNAGAIVGGTTVWAYLAAIDEPDAQVATWTSAMRGFVQELISAGSPNVWVPAEGALPAIVDCSHLTVDVGGAIGVPGMQVSDTTAIDEGMSEPLPRESVAAGGRSRCSWSGGDARVSATLLSGGGWFEPGAAATPISIPGATSAYLVCIPLNPDCSVAAVVGIDAVSIELGPYYSQHSMTQDQLLAAAAVIVPAVAALPR
jgi:hypothetical protein